MNAPALRALAEESTSERRRIILDAAERSFTRAGFHRTTMQDVAAEAGMSPGNLYRYFPSKDALVAGLCERDRVGLATEFAEMRESGGDFLAAFRELGRRHFEDSPATRQGEALPRNLGGGDAQSGDRRAADRVRPELRRAARRRRSRPPSRQGAIHPDVDMRAVASIIGKLGDGLFVRRAVASDFDAEREIAEVFAVVGALLKGAVKFPGPLPTPESTVMMFSRILAVVIVVAATLWIGSGVLGRTETPTEGAVERDRAGWTARRRRKALAGRNL